MKRFRWWVLVFVLIVLILLPFFIWGEWFEKFFDLQGAKHWLEGLGHWAWIGGIGLLLVDLFLPIPGTVVISALGLVYGWWWGGLIGSVGSVLSGLAAYALCRFFGRPAALWLAGVEGLEKGSQMFARESAGWLVALSRWMPVLPEAVACLAGVTRMPLHRFVPALLAGSLPLGFAFAGVGALGVERPGLALWSSAILPVLLYGLAAWCLKSRNTRSK